MYKISLEKFLVSILIISTILGYTISYGKLYLFHIVALLYYLAIVSGLIKLSKKTLQSTFLLIILFLYCCISLLWTSNITNGLTYIFYLICGLTIVIAVVNYAYTQERLNFIFKVSAVMLLINFFIGLIETTGYFRLPVSPYAIPGTFKNLLPGWDHPSGFNFNLNNFGFVFAIYFPFVFLYPKRLISFLGFLTMLWFTYKLQSKGFFLGIIVFFTAYLIVEIKRKSILFSFFIGILIVLIIASFYLEQITTLFQGRIFTLFDQISRGIDLIKSGDIIPQDSTSERAYFYATGLKTLFKNYGLGEGIAGISSLLGNIKDEPIISFHFFFLELLIDLGLIPFFILMFFYVKLVINLLRKASKKQGITNNYYMRASGYSLIILLPASIAPSSIIYILPFWLIIGLSISIQNSNDK